MNDILFETNEIKLRQLRIEDSFSLFIAIDQNREFLVPWFNWADKVLCEHDASKIIRTLDAQCKSMSGVSYGVFINERLVGAVGMHSWDKLCFRSSLGFWIHYDFQGKGYMVKIMKEFIGYLFKVYAIRKLEIHYLPENYRCASLAKRLGFKPEGVIRGSVCVNEEIRDNVITGITREEWIDSTVSYL